MPWPSWSSCPPWAISPTRWIRKPKSSATGSPTGSYNVPAKPVWAKRCIQRTGMASSASLAVLRSGLLGTDTVLVKPTPGWICGAIPSGTRRATPSQDLGRSSNSTTGSPCCPSTTSAGAGTGRRQRCGASSGNTAIHSRFASCPALSDVLSLPQPTLRSSAAKRTRPHRKA